MAARPTEPLDPAVPELDVALAVMGNRTKSLIVRHLWQHGPSRGTEITAATEISAPTMSLAMQQLESWGIVTGSIPPSERHGRSVTYTLDRDRVRNLVTQWTGFVEGTL